MSETVFDLVDESGVVRFRGTADPPIGGGGGGISSPVTVQITNPADGLGGAPRLTPCTIVGDGTIDGIANGVACGVPLVVEALADVVAQSSAVVRADGTVVSTGDALDFELTIYVTDLAGANVAQYSLTDALPAPVTAIAHALSNADDHWTILAGADLSADGGALVSTAGGVYVVTMRGSVGWD